MQTFKFQQFCNDNFITCCNKRAKKLFAYFSVPFSVSWSFRVILGLIINNLYFPHDFARMCFYVLSRSRSRQNWEQEPDDKMFTSHNCTNTLSLPLSSFSLTFLRLVLLFYILLCTSWIEREFLVNDKQATCRSNIHSGCY